MAAFIFSLLDPRPLALNLWATALILKLLFLCPNHLGSLKKHEHFDQSSTLIESQFPNLKAGVQTPEFLKKAP